jgi:hypothetical protein
MATQVHSTGELAKADNGSLRISYGPTEEDLGRQQMRHRRFYVWTENGVKFGSWTWQPGWPPADLG